MRGSLLVGSLYVIAAGILAQAMLAGFFISGTSDARMIHVIVGAVLPYLGIVPVVSAWRGVKSRGVPIWVAVGSTALLIGLWVQEALGHMPWPVTTVIHVPLGVALFSLSLYLAMATSRSSRSELQDVASHSESV